MIESKVAILGAGVSGLYVARLLKATGIPFVLIEARDRLGGRVVSVDYSGKPSEDGFDLGPSWFWPQTQPAIGRLVEELGLSAFAQNSNGDAMFERIAREAPQRYHSSGQDPQSMRLAGGTAALVKALAEGLPAEQIWLGTRATAMVLCQGGVELTLTRADCSTAVLEVNQVIAALPPRLLESTVAFTPSHDRATARRWRDTPTWMAPHAKFLGIYERPFWRDSGLSGTAQSMVGPMAEIHDACTASGAAALFGFIAVSSEHRAALGEAAITEACVDQLARIFGAEARTPQATLLKDWAADPLTATPADSTMGGHPVPRDALWVTGPWRERLALAGSETSPSDPGYLSGAVVAGQRAVTETRAKLDALMAARTSHRASMS